MVSLSPSIHEQLREVKEQLEKAERQRRHLKEGPIGRSFALKIQELEAEQQLLGSRPATLADRRPSFRCLGR